jgi:outer membrane protein OmpA-like peptidoglycan-associated protein
MTRAIVLILFAAACGGAKPKPPELDALQALRASAPAQQSAKVAPQLIHEVDIYERDSKSEWKDGELENSRRDALMGSIKLKMAIAQWDQGQAKARIAAADADKAKSDKELARLTKDLNAVQEQVALLDKLAGAKSAAEVEKVKAEQEKQKLASELAAQKQKGDAQGKISGAELAIKNADTVEAGTYAKADYQAAVDLLARAQSELASDNVSAASTSADLAKQKAEAAFATAKPEYGKAAESKDRKARDEALARDAAALTGISVRLDTKGDVARLVLVFSGGFKAKSAQLAAGKDSVVDGLAGLLKKYPTYPVQLVGYTDTTGRSDANLVISNARAQTVYDALVTRGVDAKRFVVSGQGSANPIGDNRTAKGRDQNNRIELIFLYQ